MRLKTIKEFGSFILFVILYLGVGAIVMLAKFSQHVPSLEVR